MNQPASLDRLLIVRNDRIGDLVLTLPAIEAVRHALPHAHVAVLVSPYAAPLLAGHPAIDEVLVDRPEDNARGLARRLRGQRFDAALVIHTSTRNCLGVLRAGIRHRVTWAYKPAGWLCGNRRVALRRSHPPVHESEFALAFVRRLGLAVDTQAPEPRLTVETVVAERMAARIRRDLGAQGPLFGIHPGSKHSAYNWPVERYAELAARLTVHGRVIITGSADEIDLLDQIRQSVRRSGAPQRLCAYSDLSLTELTAVIAEQNALTVSSTGPMHLAGVLGTPVVALFSPHPAHLPAKWAPLGSGHVLLQPTLAPGEDPAIEPARAADVMDRISVSQVVGENLQLVNRSAKHVA